MSLIGILGASVTGVALLLVLYAIFVEPLLIRVNRADLWFSELPNSLDGFTICHLSDMHVSRYGAVERLLVRLLLCIEADIYAITGDSLNAMGGRNALRRVLGTLRPRLGSFAVMGNGDHKLDTPSVDLAGLFEESGASLMTNRHISLSSEGADMTIIGVSDPFLGMDDLDAAMPGSSDETFRLLLAHSPDILMRLGGRHVDLVLAGHTHGGQIRVPFIGPVWLHCRHSLGIASGYLSPEDLARVTHDQVQGPHVYVSRGVASGNIRARFMCPPEIAVLTLRRRFQDGRDQV